MRLNSQASIDTYIYMYVCKYAYDKVETLEATICES